MKNKSFTELLNEALAKEPDLNFISLDLDKVKENLSQATNEKLCEMIVCDRYFGFEKKISSLCMEELGNRRSKGDIFNFEEYIEQSYKSLPVMSNVMPNIRDVLQQAISSRK